MKMRHDYNSIGAQFLNCFGLELEETERALNYIFDQCYLNTFDVKQVDVCYVGSLPSSINSDMILKITANETWLWPASTLKEFFLGFKAQDDLLLQQNPYYIDWQKRLIYVRYPYLADENNPEGKIKLSILNNNKEVFSAYIQLKLHQIWNALDEFGLLLHTPRIYGEDNTLYLERLISVFRYPGGAHYQGMLNSISRGLCLTRRIYWPDRGKDLPLNHAHILLNSIQIDGQSVSEEDYQTDDDMRVILFGSNDNKGKSGWVYYAYGVQLFTLFDASFRDELFTSDGEATEKLIYYTKAIQHLLSINWGQFIWGQGGWIKRENNSTCIPTFFDAKVSGWEKYEEQV